MPGLNIVYDLTGSTSKQELEILNDLMAKAMTHFDWYGRDSASYNSVAFSRVNLGLLNTEPQPTLSEDGSIAVMLDGELYNSDEIKDDLSKLGYEIHSKSDTELVLHLYDLKGLDFVQKLNGSFIILIYNISENSLLVCNDRYGTRPLYWCQHHGRLLVASEVKSILADGKLIKKINYSGLVDLMVAGYLLHDKTLIEGIELLPAATMLIAEKKTVRFRKYWSWDDIPRQQISYKEAIEKMGHLWLQAVKRQAKGSLRLGVTLSGGLDSRAVQAAAVELGFLLPAWTFGKEDCQDIEIARQVCKVLGTDHHVSYINGESFKNNINQIVWLADGSLDVVNGAGLDMLRLMRMQADVRLHAFALDLIAGGSYLLPENISISSHTDFENYLLGWYPKQNRISLQSLPNLLAGSSGRYARDIFINNVSQSVKEFVFDLNATDYYFLNNRVRRIANTGSIMTSSFLVDRKPPFDNDFIEFVYGLPSEWRADSRLYSDMLLSFFPSVYRTIPWHKTGIPLGLPKTIQMLNSQYSKGKSAANLGCHFMGIPPIFYRNKNPVDYNNWMRNDPGLKQFITEILLGNRAAERGFFDPTYVKTIVDLHMTARGNFAPLLGVLLTFEIFCRQFIDGETPDLVADGNMQ